MPYTFSTTFLESKSRQTFVKERALVSLLTVDIDTGVPVAAGVNVRANPPVPFVQNQIIRLGYIGVGMERTPEFENIESIINNGEVLSRIQRRKTETLNFVCLQDPEDLIIANIGVPFRVALIESSDLNNFAKFFVAASATFDPNVTRKIEANKFGEYPVRMLTDSNRDLVLVDYEFLAATFYGALVTSLEQAGKTLVFKRANGLSDVTIGEWAAATGVWTPDTQADDTAIFIEPGKQVGTIEGRFAVIPTV